MIQLYSVFWCNQSQITNEQVDGVSVLDEITCLDHPPRVITNVLYEMRTSLFQFIPVYSTTDTVSQNHLYHPIYGRIIYHI
jgi:hypothetical protein